MWPLSRGAFDPLGEPFNGLLIFPLLLPESPRWLVSKSRGSDDFVSITTAAKSNKLPLPGNVLLKNVAEGEQRGICSLGKQPTLIFRLFVVSLNWIVITLCYYGLSMNSGNQDLFIGLGKPSLYKCQGKGGSIPFRSFWVFFFKIAQQLDLDENGTQSPNLPPKKFMNFH